jgi:hypothetical protein
MLLPQTNRGEAGCAASRHDVANPPHPNFAAGRAARLLFKVLVAGVVLCAAETAPLCAGTLSLPNASFESSLAPRDSPYAFADMEYWQKSLQPTWYDPSTNYNTPWAWLMGTFYNAPFLSTYIDNCDGTQAAFVFALPEVAVFQDYDSIYGTNTAPSHAFNAHFNTNCAYTLTVGVIGGVNGYPPLYEGATLQVSLYYRNAAGNMVAVAATALTNTGQLFPTNTHFVDFSVYLPGVRASDPWAGQNVGVQIASTVGFDKAGGYWDVDNVRLTETPLPALTDPGMTNSQFRFNLQSQPGLRFEILAATNPASPLSNWSSLATLTNGTGIISFLDPAPNPNRCFYRARQLP